MGTKLCSREAVAEDGRVLVEKTASTARNTAIGANEYNWTWLPLSIGPRIGYAVPFVGRDQPADLGVERRWRGGDGYASNLWTKLGLDQALDVGWSLALHPAIWVTRHGGQSSEVGPTHRSRFGFRCLP